MIEQRNRQQKISGKCVFDTNSNTQKNEIEFELYRLQIIFGAGNPSARHVILMFWFSRTATDDGVLSISKIFGGTTFIEWWKHIKKQNRIYDREKKNVIIQTTNIEQKFKNHDQIASYRMIYIRSKKEIFEQCSMR